MTKTVSIPVLVWWCRASSWAVSRESRSSRRLGRLSDCSGRWFVVRRCSGGPTWPALRRRTTAWRRPATSSRRRPMAHDWWSPPRWTERCRRRTSTTDSWATSRLSGTRTLPRRTTASTITTTIISMPSPYGTRAQSDAAIRPSIRLSHSLSGCTVCPRWTAVGRGHIVSPRDILLSSSSSPFALAGGIFFEFVC